MTQPLQHDSLELFALGKPVGHMGAVLALDMFKNGAMDVYFGEEHYRVLDIWPVVNDLEIAFEDMGRSRVVKFERGCWIDCPRPAFDSYLSVTAPMIAIHDSTTRLLRFVIFANGFDQGRPVRFVLYPEGRLPKPGDHQIIGWRDHVNPIIGSVLKSA